MLLLNYLKDRHISFIGILFICTGFILNEWLLAFLFLEDHSLELNYTIQIRTFDITMIFFGTSLLLRKILNFNVLRWMNLGLLSLLVMFFLSVFIWRIQFKLSIDYNEGWNAYNTHAAISDQPIYDSQKEFTTVNYPPGSFYIVGIIGKILGDQLLAGRCISLISLILIVFGTGYLVKKLGRDIFDALFATVICLGLFVVYAPHYIGMNDPQLLANIFTFGGLVIYLHNPDRLLPAAILCSLGIIIKHSVIALPAALTIEIFFRSRRNFFKWIGYMTIITGALFFLTYFLSGGSFFRELSTTRRYSLEKLFYWLIKIGKDTLIIFLVACPWLVYSIKKNYYRIIPFYFIISLFIGIYFSGGLGTDINMFFDLFISLSVAAGMSFSYAWTKFHSLIIKPYQVSFILTIALGVSLFPGFFKQLSCLESYLQSPLKEKAFLNDVSYLESRSGPILCENILLGYYAGKIFEYDPFLMREQLLLGQTEESKILGLLEKGYFKTIQLEHSLPDRYSENLTYTSVMEYEYFTENFMRALGKYYILVHKSLGGTCFFEPKKTITDRLVESEIVR